MARLLLSDDYNADVLATSKTGDTPLHVAARWGYIALVELLIARYRTTFGDEQEQEGSSRASGTDIDEPNNVGYGPLRMAVRFGHYDAAKALLDAGANPRRKDPNGDGTLCMHVAARNGHARIVRLLAVVDRPSSVAADGEGNDEPRMVDAVDSVGLQPIHWAATEGHADALTALIEVGADVNAPVVVKETKRQMSGDRALHLAVRKGHVAAVRVLVEIGKAALEEPGIDGLTALRIALTNQSQEISEILLKNGASTDT